MIFLGELLIVAFNLPRSHRGLRRRCKRRAGCRL